MYPPKLILAASFTLTDGLSIAGIVLLIMLSAFFSASETAFSTVSPLRIKSYADEKVKGGRRAQYIVDHFDMALVSLLVGNNLVNIASTTLCAYMFSKFVISPTVANLLNTVVMTIIILIAGEILPKAYAKHNPEKFVLKVSGIIYVFMKVIYVLAIPFYGLQKLMLRKTSKDTEPTITEDDLENIVDTMAEEGVIDSNNAEMLQGVLDIQERTVYEIMVPRVDMVAIPVDISEEELKANFVENQYSRLPVYEEDKDNIVGILNQKDFVTCEYSGEKPNVRKLMTEPLKVAKTTKVDDLISQMRQTKKHLAIVIDEYGGTSGLVTMEDALEEVFGEIYDEHDDKVEPIVKLDENQFKVSPDLSVEELFEYLEIEHLPETNYSSVGGIVYSLLEHIPKVGNKVKITAVDDVLDEHNNYVSYTTELEFTVTKCDDDRITELLLKVTHLEPIEK
ncbi:MAG: HlyC/CorC family transporter [Clostridia bacterium]|nr:HlyC/CorC family transporter [Clostridia bacterium]